MVRRSQIQEHMEVLDNQGIPLGRVDHWEGPDRIRLSAQSPRHGSGPPHIIPLEWVETVIAGRLRLSKSVAEAETTWH